MADVMQEIEKLSVSEKILLVEKIWDDIAQKQGNMPIPDWHKQILEEREAEYKKNPNDHRNWEEVRKKYYR